MCVCVPIRINVLLISLSLQSEADVVACLRNPVNDVILALDAWNIPGAARGNVIDPDNSQDVTLISGNFTNQRISCM